MRWPTGSKYAARVPDPLMRASHVRSNIEALSDLGEEAEREIRARCADVIAAVEESISLSWLPLELDVALTGAVHAVCGADALNRWSRDAITKSSDGPLLRPILSALRRIGLSPGLILKRVPYGWSLIYRHCGEMSFVSDEAATGELRLADAPRAMRGSVYLDGISGAFEGLMTIGGVEGVCEHRTDASGLVRFVNRWGPEEQP